MKKNQIKVTASSTVLTMWVPTEPSGEMVPVVITQDEALELIANLNDTVTAIRDAS